MTLANQLVLADRLNDAVNLADGTGFDACLVRGFSDESQIWFIIDLAHSMGMVAAAGWDSGGLASGWVHVSW